MTTREQWEEIRFLELANGDSGVPFPDGWDDPENDPEDLNGNEQ